MTATTRLMFFIICFCLIFGNFSFLELFIHFSKFRTIRWFFNACWDEITIRQITTLWSLRTVVGQDPKETRHLKTSVDLKTDFYTEIYRFWNKIHQPRAQKMSRALISTSLHFEFSERSEFMKKILIILISDWQVVRESLPMWMGIPQSKEIKITFKFSVNIMLQN